MINRSSRKQRLKELIQEKIDLELKLEVHKNRGNEIDGYINQLESFNEEITELQSDNIIITDHACLRYLSRVMKYDIKAFKLAIVADLCSESVNVIKTGKFRLSSNHQAIIVDKVVVTIY